MTKAVRSGTGLSVQRTQHAPETSLPQPEAARLRRRLLTGRVLFGLQQERRDGAVQLASEEVASDVR